MVDYGIFNVVAGLVTMFSSLSSIISSATQRFHSYALGEKREDKVSDVFTVSINIYAILALAILIAGEIIGIWFINFKADIPADRMITANWVFQLTMFSFVVGLMTSPFSSLIFAYEKMQEFSVISVCDCVLKFLLAYSLLYIAGDHLLIYGIGLLLIQFLSFIAYYITSRRGCGEYHYKKRIEKTLYMQMLSFSGWTLFSSSASIGISQLVTMVTNVFYGPVVNAARAIAFQVNTAMNSFTGNVTVAFRPPMIKQYAEGDFQKVIRYFNFSNKAIFYSLLLILPPVFFEMETVLKLWLGVDDTQTTLFCRLILIYALILSLNNPISIIIQATGNIRAYSTYVEIPTLLCFPATWLLYYHGFPPESAFYVMIFSIVISHIIRLICLKKLFNSFSYKEYIVKFVVPAFVVIVVASFVLFEIRHFIDAGYLRVFVSFLINAIVIGVLAYYLGLMKSERNMLLSLLKSRNHK